MKIIFGIDLEVKARTLKDKVNWNLPYICSFEKIQEFFNKFWSSTISNLFLSIVFTIWDMLRERDIQMFRIPYFMSYVVFYIHIRFKQPSVLHNRKNYKIYEISAPLPLLFSAATKLWKLVCVFIIIVGTLSLILTHNRPFKICIYQCWLKNTSHRWKKFRTNSNYENFI